MCGLPKGWLQILIAWNFRHFSIIPIFVNNVKLFAHLGEVTNTPYAAAALPVANLQGDADDTYVIQYTGTEMLWKIKWPGNNYIFLQPYQYLEENFALTQGRIPVCLNCLFLTQWNKFGIVTPLVLVTTLIPYLIYQPSGLLMGKENPQDGDST